MYKREPVNYSNKIVAFDIEATGSGLKSDAVQFAMVNENRKMIWNLYTCPTRFTKKYLKWQMKMSSKIHHITYEKIAGRPPLYKFRKQIQNYLNGADIIVGFSIVNDIYWLKRNGINIRKNQTIIDVQLLFMIYRYVQKGQKDWNRMYSLTKCAEYCEYPPKKKAGRFHNALGDASASIFCYEYLENQGVDLSVGRTDPKGKPLLTREQIDESFSILKQRSMCLKEFA